MHFAAWSDAQFLAGLPRGSIEIRVEAKFASVASRIRARLTSVVATWILFLDGPADDGRSVGTLTPACESAVPLYLPPRFKRSPFCVVTPCPSPAGSPILPGSTFSPPSFSPRHSLPSFPRFFFSLRPASSSPDLPFRTPFFPGTSLSTRLTPPLVVYLESSITCT